MSPISWYCFGLECTQPCGVSRYGVNRCGVNRNGMKRIELWQCFYPELPAVALSDFTEPTVMLWSYTSLFEVNSLQNHSLKSHLHPDAQHKVTSEPPVHPPCNLALVSSSTLNSSNQLSWQKQTGPTSVTGCRNRSSNTQSADEIRLLISSNDENRKRQAG